MSDAIRYILNYTLPIITCICLLVFIHAGRTSLLGGISRYFVVGTCLILGVVVFEIGEHFFGPDYCKQVNWQRWVFSILAYILRPGIAYILLLVPLRDKKKEYALYLAIPLMINALLLFISPFTGLVFSFDSVNTYSGGPLKSLPFVVSGIYLATFLVFSFIRTQKYRTSELITSIPIIIMCCLAVILESEFEMYGSLPQACVTGMLLYYMYFCIDCYNKDSLTGAYRRNKFHRDAYSNGYKYFIIFDINGLKRINDNKGHMAGDVALQSFSKSAMNILPKKANLYRIGGDEMGILYYGASEDDVLSFLSALKSSVSVSDLPFGYSYGYAPYDVGVEFNGAYKIADEMMYNSKNAFWAKFRKNESELSNK